MHSQIKKHTIIALCGREGSGKSTAGSLFVKNNSPEVYKYENIYQPEPYIMSVLFGWDFETLITKGKPETRDVIWDLTYDEAKAKVMNLMRNWIDPTYTYPTCSVAPVVGFQKNPEKPKTKKSKTEKTKTEKYKKRKIIAFADPIKKIAAVMFNLDHNMLLAETPETRILRETTTKKYSTCGTLTGRTALEYLGTNVFRNNFDIDIWIKIFKRDVSVYLKNGYSIMISDLRFVNEYIAIQRLEGKVGVIFKDEKELTLTEDDKKSHPAKWHFLRFANSKDVLKIDNSGTIDELPNALESAFGVSFS